jgi:hypothetical protein
MGMTLPWAINQFKDTWAGVRSYFSPISRNRDKTGAILFKPS